MEGRPDGLSEVHVQLLTPVNYSSLGKDPKVNYCKVNYTPFERALFRSLSGSAMMMFWRCPTCRETWRGSSDDDALEDRCGRV